LPAFWKLVIFDTVSILLAAALGYGCLLYFSGGVNFILFASAAALFLVMSFFSHLFARERRHRMASACLQIFAFLVFFYSVEMPALLSALGILVVFYLFAQYSANSVFENSLKFKFGSVARAYMKKIFIGFALAAIVLYLPQWNSNNVFIPQPKFQQWYDGLASLSQKFYVGVDLTASVGTFAESIVGAQLSTNSQFRALPLAQQKDVLQKGVQELMINMSKSLGFKLTADMSLSESFYRYLVNLFASFKNQFGGSFLAVWAVVLFVIVWSTGTLLMWLVVLAGYLLFELFSAFNIVHMGGETRTKEIVELS
jgi:hypothetical protein